jgi:outer membrane receptor protein involved in Fe transport
MVRLAPVPLSATVWRHREEIRMRKIYDTGSAWISKFAITGAMLLLATAAWGQVTTATFYGTVTDPTGAVIPSATVTLANEETGASISKVTDASGEFVFDFLHIGTYTLRIESQGFKRFQGTGMQFAAAQNMRRTFVLELGAVADTVEVHASALQVNTVSAEQREGVTTTQVHELPLARRNYTGLLTVGTGVTVSSTGAQPGHGDRDGGVRLNGLGRSGTTFTLDGTDANANNEGRSGNMFTNLNYIDIISIEAIQEVQVVKGIIAAEYGQALSGNVNIITKSGTNDFHGSAFENFQSQRLNARNQFLTYKPPVTFNQFGGSFGGPVRKNKIFFFGTYEGYRESFFRLVSENTPTLAFRDQMIQAVPAYKIALDGMPPPNQPLAPAATVGFFQAGKSGHAWDNHFVTKGDFRITKTGNLALTYTHGRPYRQEPSADLHNDGTFRGFQERGTASFVTGGAAWTSETRFGYNMNDLETIDQFLLQGVAEETQFGRRTPQISSSLGFSTPSGQVWRQHGPTWTLEEKYARHVGRHSFKFGVDFMRVIVGRVKLTAPSVQYQGLSDLLANIPSTINITFGAAPHDGYSHTFGFFAQDDWRINSKLTLNIGARYDFYSNTVVSPLDPKNPAQFNNLDGLLDNRFHFGPWRDPNNPYESDGWVNIGPRFGFAYNPDGQGRTVIRGGYGILFSPHTQGNIQQAVATKTVPFRTFLSKAEAAANNQVFPVYNDDARKVVEALSLKSGVINLFAAFNPHLQNPYSMNIYFGIQRTLSPSWMLESAFIATRGVKFPMERVFNAVDRLTGVRPNPNLGEGYYEDSTQNTVYTSWQTSLRKRYSSNLTGAFHYTWGKNLSTAGGDIGGYYQGDTDLRTQDFFNPRADRGPSAGDVTHYFAYDLVYDLPGLTGRNAVLRAALGGWEVSSILAAMSGQPLLITQSSSLQVSRPDYIGGNALFSNSRQTLQYLNRAAFALVPISSVSGATIRPGNVGNGAVRGPGLVNVDFSLGKNIPVTEQLKLQIRADSFDFFNHTNFTGLSTSLNSPTFGRFTSTRGARVVQLSARLRF